MKNLIGPKEALSRLESFKTVEKPECEVLSKVPAVTLGFWIIKIAATTLGETGGDSVTMTLRRLRIHRRNNYAIKNKWRWMMIVNDDEFEVF